jgi:hypothetical protein
MIFAASEETANKSTHNDISTCQSIEMTEDISFIIPQTETTLKKIFPLETQFFGESKNQCHKDDNHKEILTLEFLKLHQLKWINLKPIKFSPFKLRLFHIPKNRDKHNLL